MKCAQGQIVVGNEEVGIGQLKFALPNLSKGLEKYLTIIVAWYLLLCC